MRSESPHVVRSLPLDQRTIFVVDGLFTPVFVRMIHHFMRHLPAGLTESDSEQALHAPHWNHEFDPHNLPPMPLLPEFVSQVVATCQDLCPSRRLTLERLHCNFHLYGDAQYTHTDLASGLTGLYYANPAWPPTWMGETIFYAEDGEPRYAVIPKPGRLVVFDGDIVHRGGVPSRECFEPRISVAFKFTRSDAVVPAVTIE